MALLKNVKVKDSLYDLASKYDSDGNEIKTTYATQEALTTTNSNVDANTKAIAKINGTEEGSIASEISKVQAQIDVINGTEDGSIIKAVAAETEAREAAVKTVSDLVSTINGSSNVEGSFRKAIKDLIGGAPETYDTLKEIADKLASDDDLHTAINEAITKKAAQTDLDDTNSNVTALQKTIQNLDLADTATAGQFVTKVTQTDGLIAVTREGVNSSQVTRTAGDIKATTVEAALTELLGKINSLNTDKAVTVSSSVGTYTNTYTISQGSTELGSIEVSKAPEVAQNILYL